MTSKMWVAYYRWSYSERWEAVDEAPFEEELLSRFEGIYDREFRLDGNRSINSHVDRS